MIKGDRMLLLALFGLRSISGLGKSFITQVGQGENGGVGVEERKAHPFSPLKRSSRSPDFSGGESFASAFPTALGRSAAGRAAGNRAGFQRQKHPG
jgi:hypothetical protein